MGLFYKYTFVASVIIYLLVECYGSTWRTFTDNNNYGMLFREEATGKMDPLNRIFMKLELTNVNHSFVIKSSTERLKSYVQKYNDIDVLGSIVTVVLSGSAYTGDISGSILTHIEGDLGIGGPPDSDNLDIDAVNKLAAESARQSLKFDTDFGKQVSDVSVGIRCTGLSGYDNIKQEYNSASTVEKAKTHNIINRRSRYVSNLENEKKYDTEGKPPRTSSHTTQKHSSSMVADDSDVECKSVYTITISYYSDDGGKPSSPKVEFKYDDGAYEVISIRDRIEPTTMKGNGGNPKTGKYTYGSMYYGGRPLDVTPWFGLYCLLRNDHINVDSSAIQGNCYPFGTHSTSFEQCDPGTSWDYETEAYGQMHDALFFGSTTYEMLDKWYGDTGLIDNCPTIRMCTHYGGDYDNAFYVEGTCDTYFGGGNLFYPLAVNDVVGHEIGHAYTYFSSSLEYTRCQSGSMNEAFSDLMGETLEAYVSNLHNDWYMGFDMMKGELGQYGGHRDALRYFKDPTHDGLSIDCAGDFKYMDPHHGSGVINKAFYILSHKCNWSIRRAFALFLHANHYYWGSTDGYWLAAYRVWVSAYYNTVLGYTFTHKDAQDVADAFAEVGIVVRCPRGFWTSYNPSTDPRCPRDQHVTCFKIVNDVASWAEAKVYCDVIGADLLTVETGNEQQIIEPIIQHYNYEDHHVTEKCDFWLGMTDMQQEGSWKTQTESTTQTVKSAQTLQSGPPRGQGLLPGLGASPGLPGPSIGPNPLRGLDRTRRAPPPTTLPRCDEGDEWFVLDYNAPDHILSVIKKGDSKDGDGESGLRGSDQVKPMKNKNSLQFEPLFTPGRFKLVEVCVEVEGIKRVKFVYYDADIGDKETEDIVEIRKSDRSIWTKVCLHDLPADDIAKLRIKFTTYSKNGKGYVQNAYVQICYRAEGTTNATIKTTLSTQFSPETGSSQEPGPSPAPSPVPKRGPAPDPSPSPSAGPSPAQSRTPTPGTSLGTNLSPSQSSSTGQNPSSSPVTYPTLETSLSPGKLPGENPLPSSWSFPVPSHSPNPGQSPGPSNSSSSRTSPGSSPSLSQGISSSPSPSSRPRTSPNPRPSSNPEKSQDVSPSPSQGTFPGPKPPSSQGTSPSPNPSSSQGASPAPSPTSSPGITPGLSPSSSTGISPGPSPLSNLGTSTTPSPSSSPGTTSGPSSSFSQRTSLGPSPSSILGQSTNTTATPSQRTSPGQTQSTSAGPYADPSLSSSPGTSQGPSPSSSTETSPGPSPSPSPGSSPGPSSSTSQGTSPGPSPPSSPGTSPGPRSTSSTRTSPGPSSTPTPRTSPGPNSTPKPGTSPGSSSAPSPRTSPSPSSSPSPRTSPGPSSRTSPGRNSTPKPGTSLGPNSTASPRTSPGPSSTPKPDTSPGPSATPSQRTSPGPSSTPSPRTSPGPSSTPSPRTSPGPSSTPKPGTSLGPNSTASPRTSPGPSSTPSQRTSPGPSSTPSPRTSPGPSSTPKPGTSPGSSSTPSPGTSPGSSSTPKPGTSPGPSSTPSPRTSLGPSSTPKPETSPSPSSTPSPGTSPGPISTYHPVTSPGTSSTPSPGPSTSPGRGPSRGPPPVTIGTSTHSYQGVQNCVALRRNCFTNSCYDWVMYDDDCYHKKQFICEIRTCKRGCHKHTNVE